MSAFVPVVAALAGVLGSQALAGFFGLRHSTKARRQANLDRSRAYVQSMLLAAHDLLWLLLRDASSVWLVPEKTRLWIRS